MNERVLQAMSGAPDYEQKELRSNGEHVCAVLRMARAELLRQAMAYTTGASCQFHKALLIKLLQGHENPQLPVVPGQSALEIDGVGFSQGAVGA